MRDRRDPWKWPVTIGLSVSLMLAAALWLPRSWLGFLLGGTGGYERLEAGAAERWLTILPPPNIEVANSEPEAAPEPELPTPPLHTDPRWWQDGWVVGAEEDGDLFASSTAAVDDTLAFLLTELGLGEDFMTRARPDSVLAARLFLLEVEDGFRFDELKPYFESVTRGRAYADILSRAADMYDEHLAQEIRAPD